MILFLSREKALQKEEFEDSNSRIKEVTISAVEEQADGSKKLIKNSPHFSLQKSSSANFARPRSPPDVHKNK